MEYVVTIRCEEVDDDRDHREVLAIEVREFGKDELITSLSCDTSFHELGGDGECDVDCAIKAIRRLKASLFRCVLYLGAIGDSVYFSICTHPPDCQFQIWRLVFDVSNVTLAPKLKYVNELIDRPESILTFGQVVVLQGHSSNTVYDFVNQKQLLHTAGIIHKVNDHLMASCWISDQVDDCTVEMIWIEDGKATILHLIESCEFLMADDEFIHVWVHQARKRIRIASLQLKAQSNPDLKVELLDLNSWTVPDHLAFYPCYDFGSTKLVPMADRRTGCDSLQRCDSFRPVGSLMRLTERAAPIFDRQQISYDDLTFAALGDVNQVDIDMDPLRVKWLDRKNTGMIVYAPPHIVKSKLDQVLNRELIFLPKVLVDLIIEYATPCPRFGMLVTRW